MPPREGEGFEATSDSLGPDLGLIIDEAGDIVEPPPTEVDPGPPLSRAMLAARQRATRHRRSVGIGFAALVVLLVVTPKAHRATASGVTVPRGVTAPAAPGTAGLTKAGVPCGPKVHQIPWSPYSAVCVPAWHGNNGGATTRGVTAKTITVSTRDVATADLQLLYAILPPSIVGTNSEGIQTMQSYVRLFNRYFELYGRSVVLRDFSPQGNFVSEDTGSGQAQAEADAVTAADSINAFADFSMYGSSELYLGALHQQDVVSFGLYLLGEDWFRQNAPYEYSVGPNCTKADTGLAALLGKQMAGLPAAFAGDASLRQQKRVFGSIFPSDPGIQTCEDGLAKEMARYGAPFRTSSVFVFNLADLQSSLETAVARMKAAGVTTVVLSGADPVSPSFIMGAADSQNYHPEWVIQSLFAGTYAANDGFIRNNVKGTPDQAAGVLQIGTAPVPPSEQESLKAYELANGGSSLGILPDSRTLAFSSLMELFDLLQATGPYLTPATFHKALANTAELQPVTSGDLGGWSFGPGQVDPASNYQLLRFSPATTSYLDGQPGALVACTSLYSYAKRGADVPRHAQPACPAG